MFCRKIEIDPNLQMQLNIPLENTSTQYFFCLYILACFNSTILNISPYTTVTNRMYWIYIDAPMQHTHANTHMHTQQLHKIFTFFGNPKLFRMLKPMNTTTFFIKIFNTISQLVIHSL